jgi:hypothetical protein
MNEQELEIKLLEKKLAFAKSQKQQTIKQKKHNTKQQWKENPQQGQPTQQFQIPKSAFGGQVRVPNGKSDGTEQYRPTTGQQNTTNQSTQQPTNSPIASKQLASVPFYTTHGESFNVNQVVDLIKKYYDYDFEKITIVYPLQMVDGAELLFIYPTNNSLVASARIKIQNIFALIDDGEWAIPIKLMNVSMGLRAITFNVEPVNAPVNSQPAATTSTVSTTDPNDNSNVKTPEDTYESILENPSLQLETSDIKPGNI